MLSATFFLLNYAHSQLQHILQSCCLPWLPLLFLKTDAPPFCVHRCATRSAELYLSQVNIEMNGTPQSGSSHRSELVIKKPLVHSPTGSHSVECKVQRFFTCVCWAWHLTQKPLVHLLKRYLACFCIRSTKLLASLCAFDIDCDPGTAGALFAERKSDRRECE